MVVTWWIQAFLRGASVLVPVSAAALFQSQQHVYITEAIAFG